MAYIKKRYFIKDDIKACLFLAKEFNISMRESQRWIDKGRVEIDGGILKTKSKIIKGEVFVLEKEFSSIGLKPIFQTKDFLFFDKPSGILIHSTNRHTPYSLADEVKFQFGKNANIIHRIDKETSGLVLCSKYKEAEVFLKNLFQESKIKKSYYALVEGKIDKEILIDAPILKNREFDEIKLKVTINPLGKPSQTFIKPIKYYSQTDRTLIEAYPLTGRQHQIRIHMFHMKHKIVGDPIYGVDYSFANDYLNQKITEKERIKTTGSNRLMLHANSLEFNYHNKFKIFSKFNPLKDLLWR